MTHPMLTIVRSALEEVLERPVPELTEDACIDRDFDLDSVTFVQFLLSIEDRVPGLRFDPEALTEESFNEVSSLVAFLAETSGSDGNADPEMDAMAPATAVAV